jgi:nucleotide-binding universal stress UspA family protein
MKILLAIDTSSLARQTIATVQRMFGNSKTSVVVLCVVGENERETIPNQVRQAAVAQNLSVLTHDLVQTHEEIAADAAQALREVGLTATSQVAYGDPRRIVLDAARSQRADLIVVGCRHHSAAHRLIMGCVASHLVQHAPCNVLVVPHAPETQPRHSV